jgi:hypothetical protein
VIKPRRMALPEDTARTTGRIGTHGVLVGKPERERPLGRPRRRYVNRIKMDPEGKYWRKVGCGLHGCGLG